jgi:hypothetical protein
LNSIPNKIESFEPAIHRSFIPNLTPDPLLWIQPRLITRQVLQTKSPMSSYKKINFIPLMPSGSVHIKPDGIASKSAIKILQTGDKFPSISSRPSDHPSPAQQRSYPSKQIQSLAMWARCRNAQPLPSSCPPHSQPRMKRKSRLVLKDNRFLWSQPPEFFLSPDEIAWPLHSCPEDTYIPPASVDTPIDASKTELGELSRLSQTDASDEPPGWDHSIELAVTQILKEASLNLPLIAAELLGLTEPDAQAASRVPRPLTLDRSPGASRGLSSGASTLTRQRSTPDADPPVSAIEPQSLSLCGLPGLAVPWPVIRSLLASGCVNIKVGFLMKAQYHNMTLLPNYLLRLY